MASRMLRISNTLFFVVTFAFISTFSGKNASQVEGKLPRSQPRFGRASVATIESSLKDILSDLENLPVPSRVDGELFREMKDTFARAMELRAVERLVSKPPSGESGKVIDLVPTDNRDGTYSLSWSYRNLGDYNQDGIVDIADVSALAEVLFEPVSPANEWIDGNADGVIDMKDLEPLVEAFFSEDSSYLVEVASASEALNGRYLEFAIVPLSDASQSMSAHKFFTYSFASGDASSYAFARVTPLDRTNAPGSESDSVGIAPPGAILTVNPSFGDEGWFSSFNEVAITPQGKVIIAGSARNAFDPQWEDSGATVSDVVGFLGEPNFARESYLENRIVELVSGADFGLMDSVLDIGGRYKSALTMKIALWNPLE